MRDGIERATRPGGRKGGASLILSLCLSLLLFSLQSPLPFHNGGASLPATSVGVNANVTIAPTRPVVTTSRETAQGLFAQRHQLDHRDNRAGGMPPALLPGTIRLAQRPGPVALGVAETADGFTAQRRAGAFRLRDPPLRA